MREVEVKSVVEDIDACRSRVEAAGGRLVFAGSLADVRYDSEAGALVGRDHVLRLRIYESDGQRHGHLDWKGSTRYEDGYKVREELSTPAGDPAALAEMLSRLGFVVVKEIDRAIMQYEVVGATVRFEQYPRMDALVEVEGPPGAIEDAIRITQLPRAGFTAQRLPDFVARFEERTGQRAAVSRRELEGRYDFRNGDG